MTRPRLRRTVPSAILAFGLALAAQSAFATPAAAAPGSPAAAAGRPAPVDPRGGPATPARRAAASPRHDVHNPLLKEVFAEGEEESDEPGADVSAKCQETAGNTHVYADPAPNVDVINGDTVVPVGTQAGCYSAQNETAVVVNPYNPRNVVSASNDYRVFNTREQRNDSSGWAYTSFDAGRTWANVVAPKLTFQTGAVAPLSYMDSAGDPALAFGPANTVYYANLVFSRVVATPAQQASGLTVSVSHDGGRTFDDPVIVQLDGVNADGTPTPTTIFNDKEWIAADPRSGTVYLTWTRFTFDAAGNYLESPIMVKRSTDFGRHWSPAVRVSPKLEGFTGGITPYAQGSNPQVGRDGTLYVPYEASYCATLACDAAGDRDTVVVATSGNRGNTFRTVVVDTDYDFPDTLTGENFRLNSYPLASYDPVADRLWVTWADDRNGSYDADGASVRTNGDVFVSSSRGGIHWTGVHRLGSAADEFFPAVAAFDGRLAVSYYTRAFDPNGIGVDYAYSAGRGNGINGSPLRRITTQTEDPQVQFVAVEPDGEVIQGVFIGDYSGIAMGHDLVAHPVWTDFRGKPGVTSPNQDVYTQAIPLR